MIEVFISFFGNIFNLVMVCMFLVVGVLVGYLYQPAPKNQVLYCRERDRRGEEYEIEKEDAISLETKTDPPLRFFKYGHGYVFDVFRRLMRKPVKVTRFFAKEGTAYTWTLQGYSGKKKVELKFPTLGHAVKSRLGEEFYNEIPEEYRNKLEDNKILVTVDLEEGLTPEGFEPITERQILKKAHEDMAQLIAHGVKGAMKQPVVQYIAWIGTGVAIGLILVAIGLLKVGPVDVIVPLAHSVVS